MSPTKSRAARISPKQAKTLLQLSAGYVIAADDPKEYRALRAKGLIEDSDHYWQGDVQFARKSGRVLPCVSWEGQIALREYVERNGRLEVEMTAPLMADFKTVLRMDPKEARTDAC
jgi:hypothetical protein